MRRHIIPITTLLLAISANASGQWREIGNFAQDKPWSKTEGGFHATFVFTDSPNELLTAREKLAPRFHLKETSIAMRGVPISGIVYFTGCVPNAEGNCELFARFRIRTPEGKPWGPPIDADLWVESPPPGRGKLQLSHGNLGVVIDPEDMLGLYAVTVEIFDRVSKKNMILEQELTAGEMLHGR